jgi:hypothetical protein
MSKKLIAVASAAALALTALVGVAPASATVTLTVTGADSGDGTSSTPYLESVPVANILDAATSIAVTATATAGDVMTVTATGSVRILDAVTGASAGTLYSAASGLTSYTVTITSDDTTKDFIVYNTSTTAGTFQVSLKSATASATGAAQYMKGVAGTAYNFNVTAPATTAAGTASEVTFTVTDQFGNVLENVAAASTFIANNDSVAGLGTVPTLGAATWDATRKVYKASLSAVATPTEFAYILTVPTSDVADVSGLAKAKRGGFFAINAAGASAQVTALTTQIAALTADYNALAAKWNKRVASKTAPKKKVALK